MSLSKEVSVDIFRLEEKLQRAEEAIRRWRIAYEKQLSLKNKLASSNIILRQRINRLAGRKGAGRAR